MTALEAIEILKTDMGCYECTFGCSTPYECTNGGCPFREAIHLAVERLSIDILPKLIKDEPTISKMEQVEDEPQTDYDKGLKLFAEMLFDKEKSEQFLKECKAMGIEPQTERKE